MSKSAKRQNFLLGAMILMISNLAVKVIGAIFKLPLTEIVGVEGMAYFTAAYNLYIIFYQISTAGLPVAISRMVAAAEEKGDKNEVNKVFRVSLALFFAIGVIGTVVMMAISKSFCVKVEMQGAYYAMLAIAPTIFFICVSSAYRGYFQGLRNMIPTAVSQVIEAVGKLAIGIVAALYFTHIGESLEVTAAYVIVGVTIGVALSTFYIAAYKAMYKNSFSDDTKREVVQKGVVGTRSTFSVMKELVIISVPIALGAAIMALPSNIDTAFKPLLSNSGYTEEIATKIYGAYTSMTISLFNMPPTLVYPFGISLIPVLSASYEAKDYDKAHKTSEAAFRIASIISLPCAVGMAALSRPIISLLFAKTCNEVIIKNELTAGDVSSSALSVMAIAIFAISLIAITNSILQAWHREYVTMISTGTGVLVKLISAYILLQIPGIGALGYAISTALCYFAILIVNILFTIKYTGYIPKIKNVFLKPFVSAFLCGAFALLSYNIVCVLGVSWRISTVIAIAIAVCVYFSCMGLLKGFVEEDILLLPKGEKICRLLKRIKVLR